MVKIKKLRKEKAKIKPHIQEKGHRQKLNLHAKSNKNLMKLFRVFLMAVLTISIVIHKAHMTTSPSKIYDLLLEMK